MKYSRAYYVTEQATTSRLVEKYTQNALWISMAFMLD